MPLRVLVDGTLVLGPALTDEEWVSLRTRARRDRTGFRLQCCDARVGLRTGKFGLKHFYHIRRTGSACAHSLESEQHLLLKWLISKACIASGWIGDIEAARSQAITSGDSESLWRADVLATRAGFQPISFEVQISPIPAEEFQRRQARYQLDGVRCVWIVSPAAGRATELLGADFPAFQLWDDSGAEEQTVRVGDELLKLDDFVGAVLAGRVIHCSGPAIASPLLTLEFYVTECWRQECRAKVGFFRSHAAFRFACNAAEQLSSREFRELPSVRKFYDAIRLKPEYAALHLGELKPRRSQGLGIELRFGCPKCDALFGDHYIEPLFGEDPWETKDQVAQARVALGATEASKIVGMGTDDLEAEHAHWMVLPQDPNGGSLAE